MKLKDIVKIAAPVFLGPVAGSAVSSFLPAALASNPMVRSALVSGLGSLAFGGKPKDALRSALLGGIGGAMFPGQEAAQATQASQGSPLLTTGTAPTPTNQIAATPPAGTGTAKGIASVIGKGEALGAGDDLTMSGELLRSLNLAGEDKGNLLFKLLNTQMGEGIAAGLVAQLLAGDEEEPQGAYESRPFGEGGPGGQLGGIQYMKAGGEPDFFPRRNGGIDPSEGSGTKDDVPALLLAGEFVHTREANEGLGRMMGAKTKDEAARKGIQAQYELMDAFERMA